MPLESPVKILFVGDMHLGRRASRIPREISDSGGPTEADLGPLTALRRTVQLACREQVQAVAFAGDLVHAEDNLFEARDQLEACLEPLREAGIVIVAVAGNHDTHLMPLLANSIAGLELLGPGGTWTTCDIAPGVRLAGWSFPTSHYQASPLLDPAPAAVPNTVTIGLLHADLDAAGSSYAPVTSGELLDVGYEGWALGHIHAPDPVPTPEAPARPFYLGSLSVVPPTETGAHGPVLATIAADGTIRWERRTLAPLRWEHVEFSVADLSSESLASDPVAAVRRHLFTFAATCLPTVDHENPLLVLGLRVTLTGTHAEAHTLQRAVEKLSDEASVTKVDNCWIFIDKIMADVSVPVDMHAVAQRQDPPGLLARRILALENNDTAADPLVQRARQQFGDVALPPDFAAAPVTDELVRDYLIRAGRQALNALLAQNIERAP